MNLSEVLSGLPVREILDAATCQLNIPVVFRKRKQVLTDFVLKNLTPAVEKSLRDRLAARTPTRSGTSQRKRKREEPQPTPTRKPARIDASEPNEDGEFLEVPSDVTLKSCYRQFYEATSNAALEHVICAVCAREKSRQHDGVTDLALGEIPSPTRLAPHQPHTNHTLFDGMLLASKGFSGQKYINYRAGNESRRLPQL